MVLKNVCIHNVQLCTCAESSREGTRKTKCARNIGEEEIDAQRKRRGDSRPAGGVLGALHSCAHWRKGLRQPSGPADPGIPFGENAPSHLHPWNARPFEKSETSSLHNAVSIRDSEPRGAAARRSASQGHQGEIASRAVGPRAFETTNRDTCPSINRGLKGFGSSPRD